MPAGAAFEALELEIDGELVSGETMPAAQAPLVFDVQGSYADPTADVGEQKEHGWDHGLGEIVTALIDAGLRLDWLRESAELDWGADFLVESEPGSGRFRLPDDVRGELPLMFSLLATKPAG